MNAPSPAEMCAIVDHARPGDRANRRKPGRWLRTLKRQALWLMRRDVNAFLGACVIVMALVMAHTFVSLNEERAARLAAEEKAKKLQRAETLRKADDSRWTTRFRQQVGGQEYEWRVKLTAGDS